LTDVDRRIWVDDFAIGPEDLGLSPKTPCSIRKTTLHGGLADGVDLIEVDNGALRFSILPTRGMGIWRGEYKGLRLGWDSPVQGPVHPKFVNLEERGGLGWLAGFDETVVRCGLHSNGAPCTDVVPNNMGVPTVVPLTLHGKIANLPASRVEVRVTPGDPPALVVVGETHEAGLFFPRFRMISKIETPCGSNRITLQDAVTNVKGGDAEMELLYHCNFGTPFLAEGARFSMPARWVAPRDARAAEGMERFDIFAGPTTGFIEQCYWFGPLADGDGKTVALLRNPAGDGSVAIRFDTRALPAFTLWKNTQAREDGYVAGLEPGTDFPNAKPFERQKGRVVTLGPGETRTFRVSIEVHDTETGVASVEEEIARIQKDTPCKVHKEPLEAYSP
jgi:galactose mutarotase-like enzyme